MSITFIFISGHPFLCKIFHLSTTFRLTFWLTTCTTSKIVETTGKFRVIFDESTFESKKNICEDFYVNDKVKVPINSAERELAYKEFSHRTKRVLHEEGL